MNFTFVVPIQIPKFLISRNILVRVLNIDSISIFKYWIVLFISFNCVFLSFLKECISFPQFLLCIFLNFCKAFIHFFLRNLYHLNITSFKVFCVVSSMLKYSGLIVQGRLGFNGDNLMLALEHLGLWWLYTNLGACFCFSLLSGYFVPWFVFPLYVFRECDGCVLSVDGSAQLVCSQEMNASVENFNTGVN